MLLQMPIWFALYQSLSTNLELYHSPFALFWTDLSARDPYFVLPLLLGVLMFVQQKLTPTASMDPQQAKVMLYMMPIMITGFMLFLPAGLCLYMVTNSVLSIAQQHYIRVHARGRRRQQDAGRPRLTPSRIIAEPNGLL
jgi:YidC/Oxa1 family membrane protein insertase